ncbi:MAG TPA: hypothetical protein PLT98_04395 [Thauera aminoaromatica]|nr:hypothetical protein [Thauera aminoaromatica]
MLEINTCAIDVDHKLRVVTVTDPDRPDAPKGVRVVMPWGTSLPTVDEVIAVIDGSVGDSRVALAAELDDLRRAHETIRDKLAEAHVELEQIQAATHEAEALALAKAAAVARAAQELAELDGRISAARADMAALDAAKERGE